MRFLSPVWSESGITAEVRSTLVDNWFCLDTIIWSINTEVIFLKGNMVFKFEISIDEFETFFSEISLLSSLQLFSSDPWTGISGKSVIIGRVPVIFVSWKPNSSLFSDTVCDVEEMYCFSQGWYLVGFLLRCIMYVSSLLNLSKTKLKTWFKKIVMNFSYQAFICRMSKQYPLT